MIKNILVIEDDNDLLSLLYEFLKAKNYNVIPANNEGDALKNYSSNTDLCVIDQTIENFDTAKLIKQLKSKVSGMSFIYLASNKTDTNIGIDDVDEIINKPFCMDDILVAIEKIDDK